MSGQLLINSNTSNPLELQRSSQVGIELNDTSTGSRYLGVNSGNLRFGSNLDHSQNSLIWHSTNDGSGSGLDADLLDGVQGSSYLRSDASDTFSGSLTLTNSQPFIFDSTSTGVLYPSLESGSTQHRYVLMWDKTNNASFPFLTNRAPSGDVVIKTGTSSGGGEIERIRFNGGDSTCLLYTSDAADE